MESEKDNSSLHPEAKPDKADCETESSNFFLKLPFEPLSLRLHPHSSLIWCGNFNGEIHGLNVDVIDRKFTLNSSPVCHFKTTIRDLTFNTTGSKACAASKGKLAKIFDVNSTSVIRNYVKFTSASPTCLYCCSDNCFYFGDDDGHVGMLDDRQESPVFSIRHNEESINQLLLASHKLFAVSGDGTLSVFDPRRRKLHTQSESLNSDLLCLALIKHGSKLVVGSVDGCLNFFNWTEWGNIFDRFPVHSDSVDVIQPLSDDIICTACGDGKIRLVSILPNRILGLIGDHNDYPISSMVLTTDRKWLISAGHDQYIKAWNIEHVENSSNDATCTCTKLTRNTGESSKSKSDTTSDDLRDFFRDLKESTASNTSKELPSSPLDSDSD